MQRFGLAMWWRAAAFGAPISAFLMVAAWCAGDNPTEVGSLLPAIASGAGTASVFVPVWWVLVAARRARPTLGRGAAAGAVAGTAVGVLVMLFAFGAEGIGITDTITFPQIVTVLLIACFGAYGAIIGVLVV